MKKKRLFVGNLVRGITGSEKAKSLLMSLPGYKKVVEIFTDGSCQPNPGAGGWAALLRYGDVEKELSGFQPVATNNQMELFAAIMALEALFRPCDVNLYTDSQYVKNGITEWLPKWRNNGWSRRPRPSKVIIGKIIDFAPIKNLDLWKRLDCVSSRHNVSWYWIRGHSGYPENTRVDYLAGEARRRGSLPPLVTTID
jgi:ribonuclease HI